MANHQTIQTSSDDDDDDSDYTAASMDEDHVSSARYDVKALSDAIHSHGVLLYKALRKGGQKKKIRIIAEKMIKRQNRKK